MTDVMDPEDQIGSTTQQQINPVLLHLPAGIPQSIIAFVDFGYYPERYIIDSETDDEPEVMLDAPALIDDARERLEEILYIDGNEPKVLPELPRLELLMHEEKLTHEQQDAIRKRVRDILYLHPFLKDPQGELSTTELSLRHLAFVVAMGGEKAPSAPFDNVVLQLNANDMRRLLIKLLAASIEKLTNPDAEEVYIDSPQIEVSDHERNLLVMRAPDHASPFLKASVAQFYTS